MTTGIPYLAPPTAGSDLSRISARILGTADAAAERTTVVLLGPGGTGKSLLMAELAAAHRDAGRWVLDGRQPPDPRELTGETTVLADDAHRLDAETGNRLRALVGHPGVRLAIAFRPWPRPEPLVRLLEALGSDREVVVLGHLDRAAVSGLAREQLGDAVTPALVDRVLGLTGGLPSLVHRLLDRLAERTARHGASALRPWTGSDQQDDGVPVPERVVEAVRTDLAGLDDGARAVLHAVAAGAPVDAGLLGDMLGLPPAWVHDGIRSARAGGLLLPDGRVVPLAAHLLLATVPADVTRDTRQRVLALLVERGEEPLDLPLALADDGVKDPLAARMLARHGTAAMGSDPARAGELLSAAVTCGTPTLQLAARRAQAAALSGDLDSAVRMADAVLGDETAPVRQLAAGVAAAVSAQRGMLARSAQLFRLSGDEHAGSQALALLVTGRPAEADAALERLDATAAVTSVSCSEGLMAQGLLQSVRTGADVRVDTAAALSTLMRAAALVEPVGRSALLLDTPAALAAIVALHSGELRVAESVLRRALDAEVGGPTGRGRHLLLLAWAEMLRGRTTAARALISDAVEGAGGHLEPRDDLFRRALELGVARRSSDVPALAAAWPRAREALLRHPVDLLTLLPLGELVVAAARLEQSEHLHPHLTAAQSLLEQLGNPPLWGTPLHWSAAQAAIVAGDLAGLRPHASELLRAARTSPYAATLARAGRCWMKVLGADIDAAEVQQVAAGLASVGLGWDGSRLAGQAAARSSDPRDRTHLLQCARLLTGEDEGRVPSSVPVPSSGSTPGVQLSEREREVARLIVEGRTYREVGGKLFISAKTVEHHVARIRQRLGASSRSDLLARLRAELAADG